MPVGCGDRRREASQMGFSALKVGKGEGKKLVFGHLVSRMKFEKSSLMTVLTR
jgi:hypothetical protein